MAIFFNPYPPAQPNSALSQYQLNDIWVSQNGGPVQLTYNAITKKNSWTKYTTTPVVGGISGAVSGGPPIVASTLVASKSITAGQAVNYIPLTARGGAATASSFTVTGGTVTGLLATVTPALPSGLTLSTALTVKSFLDVDGITRLYNSVDVTVSGTAPSFGVAEQTYTVNFTDAGGQTSSATFKLTVDGGTVSVPLSSTVDIATRTITQGTADSFKPVSGSGGTAPLKYTIAPSLPTGLSIAEATGIISGTPSIYSGETEYTVTITDAGGATTTGKFRLTVIAKPVVATLAQSTPYAFTRTIPFTAFKPVNGSGGIGTLTYSAVSLPAGLSINPSTGYISGPATAVTAATTYVITVTDSNTPVASSANASITISVAELAPLNTTLSQTTTYSLTKKSQTYSFTPVTGTGGYGNLTYAASGAVSLASIGLSLNSSNGLITGNPTALLVATDFTITVSDQAVPPQTSSKTFKIEVLPLALSTTLDVPTPPPGIKNVAITTFRPVSAAGGDGTYTFSISPNITAQTGLVFNSTTGYISGTPTEIIGNTSYTVTVTDQATPTPQTSNKSFTYRVDSPPILIVNAITEKILTQYDTFTAFTPVTGTGGYGTLSYSISPTPPAGLIFSRNSGEITGPATRYLITATSFSVTVSDQALQSNTGSFLLTVNTRPLVVKTDTRSNTFIRGVSITSYKPVSATGGSETYSYALDTSLPTGLSFNTSTGFISGKPTVISTTATYSVTVTDTLNVSGSSTFDLGVNPPPTIITTSLVSSSTFYKASTVVNVSPVGLDPLHSGYGSVTFSINPDINADTGLTFSSGGVLSGTVPAAKSNFSNRIYTISATDSLGQTSSTNYTVTVTYIPLSITRVVADSTFTRSKAITPYIPATSANGSGGTSFTISPDIYANIGLNFDGTVGRIYGTPLSTCTTTVYTITAKDSDSNTASTTTNITVNDPPAITTTATSSSFTLIVNQGVTSFTPVTAAGGDGAISYIIGPTLPSGLSFDKNNGSISGTPVTISSTATYVVTATDALYQVSSNSFLLNVIPEVVSITVNNPNILLTKYSSQGLPVRPVTASGGLGSISYTLSDTLPSGLSFNTSIGEISGTPSSTSTELTYSVVATDSIGQTNSGTFTLKVNDVVIPPLIVTAPESLIKLELGTVNSFSPVTASGGFGTYTYAILPVDLPAGLQFNADGSISGNPSSVTTATSYTVTVTDEVPQNASASFQLQVELILPTSGKGYTGSRGYYGSIGYTGSRSTASGYTGSVGYAGSTGAGYTGSASTATGYTGSIGYAGSIGAGYVGSASTETGYAGSVGYVGSIGAGYVGSASTATGYTGSIGYAGSQGEIGDPGETGYTGSQGDIGFPGDPGEPGEVGYTGSASTATGYAGSIGYAGSASTATGYTGSIGYTGSQGYLGSFGYTGSASTATGYTGSASTITGYTGSQGIQGIQGNAGTSVTITGSTSTFSLLPVPYTGDIGDGYIIADTGHLAVWVGSPTNWEDVGQILGYSGSIGYTGSQGITGYTGSQGLTGYDGSQGYLGSFGYTGSIGYSGSRGEVGYTGSIGYSGSQGESSYTYSDNPPIYPEVGDRWFDSSSGLEFVWTDDGNSTQWVEIAASGFVGNTGYVGSVGNPGSMGPLHLIVALSDETSVIDVGTRIMTFRAPFGMTLTSIPRSSLGTASSSGSVLVDIKVNGTTILGSNKLSIDATEKTSTTAVTPTTLATSTIADDAEITFDITSAGTDAAGLKVTIYYSKT